jgi:hypothetical protein
VVLAPGSALVIKDGGDRPLAADRPGADDVRDDLSAEARGEGRSGSGGNVRCDVAQASRKS